MRSHHERWDGTGYPEGLSGEGIPIGARILAGSLYLTGRVRQYEYQPCIPDAPIHHLAELGLKTKEK